MMKIGASDSQPCPACALQIFVAEDLDDLLVPRLEPDRVVEDPRALLLVAGVVVLPGAVVVALVLVRLGECEPEVHVGGFAEALAAELLFHGCDLGLLEAEHLEVRHAPVDLAEVGLQRDRAAVGGERLGLLAEGLEHVGIAHLYARGIWLQLDSATVGLGALLHLPDVRVAAAESGPGHGVVGLELGRLCMEGHRLLIATGFVQ